MIPNTVGYKPPVYLKKSATNGTYEAHLDKTSPEDATYVPVERLHRIQAQVINIQTLIGREKCSAHDLCETLNEIINTSLADVK